MPVADHPKLPCISKKDVVRLGKIALGVIFFKGSCIHIPSIYHPPESSFSRCLFITELYGIDMSEIEGGEGEASPANSRWELQNGATSEALM